jgi:ABC-2 type transport system permease protein
MNDLGLVAHQFRYDLRIFRRNRQGRFFTVALPVILLVLLASIFSNDTVTVDGQQITVATYYVSHILALGIMSASFVNLIVSVTAQRDSGTLKRRRATPVPAWVLIAGRSLTAVVAAATVVVVLVAIGRVFYGVRLPWTMIPGLALTTLVGSLAFCCLAYAVTSFIRNADSAQPITQAIVLPLYFVSGVFVNTALIPAWLLDIGKAFPVYYLAQATWTPFDPATSAPGIAWRDLLVVSAWGIVGLAIALRRFSWTPGTARE